MKLIIDIPDKLYEVCKRMYAEGKARVAEFSIAKGIPYEERQISHEQECIIEELENICINNEYVLGLLAKLKNGGES